MRFTKEKDHFRYRGDDTHEGVAKKVYDTEEERVSVAGRRFRRAKRRARHRQLHAEADPKHTEGRKRK